MAAPAYVNSGTVGNTGFGTTNTPGMPASRVNGNLLIAVVSQDGGNNTTFSISGTGWVGPFDSQNSGGECSALFYCIVNGSEAAPTITCSHNSSINAQIFQYSGVVSGYTPTNFHHTVTASNGVAVTETGVTTTAADSLIAVIVCGDNSTTTLSSATGYTTDQAANGAGGNATLAAFSQSKATSGTASDAFSTTPGAAGSTPPWAAYSIEIRSANAVVSVSSTIAQTLLALTQSAAITESMPSTIAQTLSAITQSAAVTEFTGSSVIDQTFLPITQSLSVNVPPKGTWGSAEAKDTMAFVGHIPAAIPTYVAGGTFTTHNATTNLTLPLPSAEVNGDFYLAIVNIDLSGRPITTPAGWTLLQTFNTSNLNGAVYYRFGDGSGGNPVFNWMGGNADGTGKIWQFHGVVTLGAFNWTPEAGNSATFSNTGVTTTAPNSLVALVWDGNVGSVSGTPTGFTSETNESTLALFAEGEATLGSTASVTSQALSGSSRSQSFMIELCSALPPIFAAWASTEVKDVWTSRGSLIGGSWHSTEAKDIAHMSGFVPLRFAIGLTEAKDIFNGTLFEPPFGAWHSTEVKDIFAGAGTPTPPLSLDAHATGGASGSSSVGVTSATVAITTAFKDEVIVVVIHSGGFWHQGSVTGVTDTAGLFWQRRNQRQVVQNHLNGTDDSWVEEWWAHKPLVGATTITVATNPTGAIAIEAVSVAGANASAPFDTHTGAGLAIDNYSGNVIDPAGRGHFGNPAALLYTDTTQTMTLAFHASPDIQADTSVAPGFTFIDRCEHDEGSGNTLYLASMYKIESAQQFGTTDVWFGPDGTHISNRYLIIDSIVAASQPGTTDLIRWYFDGTGNRNIAQFGTGQNSMTMNLVTFRKNAVVVVAVMSLTSANARVDHISDDGNHSGWTRRGIVTDSSGAVCLETWWVEMPLAFSGNVTVTMNSLIQNGDYVSAMCFAVHGADAFQRGEIWDNNGSLPAVNHGIIGHQTVGPFNSSNDNVLVLAIGANIDTTTNSTDPTGKNKLPFLQLPAPGELVSDGPPSFNIALDYKFSEPVVTGAVAEIDISPSAQSWLMLADVMPVGPVSPPHGTMLVTEPQDKTAHNGNFTAIGIASPGGWVGFPPNHAALAATDHKDTTSNSGAFTAIWAKSEGWIGYIPAFMSLHDTERRDVLLDRGWILGPRTILGHMHAGEAPDRLGFSSPFTFYTTRYSVGDRTSIIAVTTNATLDAGTIDNLVDGVKANGAANAVTFHATQPGPVQILFDFGIPMLVNEATMYQNGPFAQPGLWHWRASNDLSAWTILTADAILDSGNIGTVVGSWPTNTTLYRYYELIQTTNAGMANIPQIWEMEFKVGGNGGTMAATERRDGFRGNMLAIPTATPIPARKRRLLIVT